MCDYKVLAHSAGGYIILCNSCGHYQLAFGTTAVTFEPKSFARFCNKVNALKETTTCNGFKNQKRIPVEISCTCSMMILSYEDLQQLHELLEEAGFSFEMEMMFEELKLVRK